MKVVSLVPSLTELLIYMNVDVVGRTKFCIHPNDQVSSRSKIGGTKTIDTDKIIELAPDLVVANKEENVKAQINTLRESGIDVYVTEIVDIESSLREILKLGELTERKDFSENIVHDIKLGFTRLHKVNIRVCYLIWRKPYMTVGGDTFIDSMLSQLGMSNIFADEARYPELEIADLARMNLDVVMLSSEPFPFKRKHMEEIKGQLPDVKVILVDGEYFSWYGSRMLKAIPYFQKLVADLRNED